MELLVEVANFTDNNGVVIEYYRYYVMIMGVKVYLKPLDKTGASLLQSQVTK